MHGWLCRPRWGRLQNLLHVYSPWPLAAVVPIVDTVTDSARSGQHSDAWFGSAVRRVQRWHGGATMHCHTRMEWMSSLGTTLRARALILWTRVGSWSTLKTTLRQVRWQHFYASWTGRSTHGHAAHAMARNLVPCLQKGLTSLSVFLLIGK